MMWKRVRCGSRTPRLREVYEAARELTRLPRHELEQLAGLSEKQLAEQVHRGDGHAAQLRVDQLSHLRRYSNRTLKAAFRHELKRRRAA